MSEQPEQTSLHDQAFGVGNLSDEERERLAPIFRFILDAVYDGYTHYETHATPHYCELMWLGKDEALRLSMLQILAGEQPSIRIVLHNKSAAIEPPYDHVKLATAVRGILNDLMM